MSIIRHISEYIYSGLEAFPDELIDDLLTPIPLGYQGDNF